MNSFHENPKKDKFLYKVSLSAIKKINKESKNQIDLSKASLDSIKTKEKSYICEYSYKKIKNIKDLLTNKNQNYNNKEIVSFKNSDYPLCLSSMTNTKNYLNSINNKFKIKNNSNNFSDKTISDYTTLYNNSIINSKIDSDNKNNFYKKLNLKLNIPKFKFINNNYPKTKLTPIKLGQSRNIKKFKFFDSSESKSLNIINYKNFSDAREKYVNIYNPKKFIKKQKEKFTIDSSIIDNNDFEDSEKLRQKIKEINKFINKDLSMKKFERRIKKKLKTNINLIYMQKELKQSESELQNLKKIQKHKYPISIKNYKKVIPKIKNYNNPNLSKFTPIKNEIENNTKINSEKKIFNIKNNIDKDKDKEISKNENIKNKISIVKFENKEKIDEENKSKAKRKKIRTISYIMKMKLTKKNKIKYTNIIKNEEKEEKSNNLNNNFLYEIKKDNNYKKFLKIEKNIEINKVSMIIRHKFILDENLKIQKEQFKEHIFNYNQDITDLKNNSVDEIYKKKMKIISKTYTEIKKLSILSILVYAYIGYINKCSLDYNMQNYLRIHVEFSTIYLPLVNLGKGKSILITDKLFSFKKNFTLFQGVKSKFVESRRPLNIPNLAQLVSLNYITKELVNYNMEALNINYLEDFSEYLESDSSKAKRNKKKLSLYSSYSFKKSRNSGFRRSTLSNMSYLKLKKNSLPSISLLEKGKFYENNINEIEEKLKNSLNNNLLLYKISGSISKDDILNNSNDLDLREKINRQYMQNIIALIREHKFKKDVSNQPIDYFEMLSKITGKDNIETILRAFIKEGEETLFDRYFNNIYRIININSKDNDGNTFLILSVKQGLNYISKLLLERGANPNIQNNEGNSALHFALSGKNFIIADLLKKFGAKEDCYNKLGYTPWDCVGKSIEII